jgi:hypothetical protein
MYIWGERKVKKRGASSKTSILKKKLLLSRTYVFGKKK